MKPRENISVLLGFAILSTSADAWKRMFETVWAWAPVLRPREMRIPTVERWDDRDEPWTDARFAELCSALAAGKDLHWALTGDDGSSISVATDAGRLELDLYFPAPPTVLEALLTLVEQFLPIAPVQIARASGTLEEPDPNGVSPITYLDPLATARLGGRALVRRAPCDVRDVPGGGLVLISRDPIGEPSLEEIRRMEAVAEFLDINEDDPLIARP